MINLKCNKFEIKSIKGIIFDKDGTITNSHIYWSQIIRMRADLICERYQINMINYSNICRSMGLDLKNNLLLPEGPIALKSRDEVIGSLSSHLNELNIKISSNELGNVFKEVHEIFSVKMNKFIKPIESAVNLIKKLSKYEVKLSLITSDSKKNADLVLNKLNLDKYFDYVIGGDANLNKKSTGIPANYVCQKLSLEKNSVIAIGDAEMDFKMSENAGLKDCILVATGQTTLNELLAIDPKSILNLDELTIT